MPRANRERKPFVTSGSRRRTNATNSDSSTIRKARLSQVLPVSTHIANTLSTAVAGSLMRNLDMKSILESAQSNDFTAMITLLPKLFPLLCYVLFIYAVAIAGIILLIVNRKKFRIDPPNMRLPKGTQAKTVCMNIGFWSFVIVCTALLIYLAI